MFSIIDLKPDDLPSYLLIPWLNCIDIFYNNFFIRAEFEKQTGAQVTDADNFKEYLIAFAHWFNTIIWENLKEED